MKPLKLMTILMTLTLLSLSQVAMATVKDKVADYNGGEFWCERAGMMVKETPVPALEPRANPYNQGQGQGSHSAKTAQ